MRAAFVKALWITLLLWPAAAAAQQPYYTDDADTTPGGKFHFDFFDEYDWLQTALLPHQRQNTFNMKVNYGVTDKIELDLDSPLLTIMNNASFIPRRPTGIGDTNFGVKIRFMDQDLKTGRPAVALATYVEVPTGDVPTGLGSGLTDFWVYGVLQKTQPRSNITLTVNAGYLFYGNTSTGVIGITRARGHIGTGGLSLIRSVTPKLSMGAEVIGAVTSNLSLQRGQLQGMVGANYTVRDGTMLDFGILGGRFAASPVIGFQIGVSIDLK